LNYLKTYISTFDLTTIFIDHIMDWYSKNKDIEDPVYINEIKPVKFPATNNWIATSLGNNDGECIDAIINLGYTDNSGHRRYGSIEIQYTEKYYKIRIYNFTITLEVHTPFIMPTQKYTEMYKVAKENINIYYEIEFEVPLKEINDVMLEHKLKTN